MLKNNHFNIKTAVENNEYIASSYVKQLLQEIDCLKSSLHHYSTYISTDSETYNAGRSEGNADVASELRKIIDPEDKKHLNLTGALKEVEVLVKFKEQAKEVLTYIYESGALKEFAYEKGDDDFSIAELTRKVYYQAKD